VVSLFIVQFDGISATCSAGANVVSAYGVLLTSIQWVLRPKCTQPLASCYTSKYPQVRRIVHTEVTQMVSKCIFSG